MEASSKIRYWGVGGRLLLAFLGISLFSLIAAASGLYSLAQVGGALNEITARRVPASLALLELSRRVESIVRAAPALLVVTSDSRRDSVASDIAVKLDQLDPYLRLGRQYETDVDASTSIAGMVGAMEDNLASLNDLVQKRLAIVVRQESLIRELTRANNMIQRILSPGKRILEAQLADWEKSGVANASESLNKKRTDLASSIIGLIPQQRAALLVDSIHNNLLEVSAAGSSQEIDVLLFPLKKSLDELNALTEAVAERAQRRLDKQITIIEGLTVGQNSIAQVRKDELAILSLAEDFLVVNEQLSRSLTERVDLLVTKANSEMERANRSATAVQRVNRNVLVVIVVLSLASSLLIVYLYVGRNLIARLTALSDSMLAIADGNLRAPLPEPGNSDEIGRMAQALVVFRDTAIEVEKSNLRDIETARRRLVDAIENSSEGFVFFDSEDRLVICNTRYRELLRLDATIHIEPGTTFDAIIRAAAASGHIVEARGREEEWVEERMELHRKPGEPCIQRRSGGRWLMITERRTGDGGTVAIYSDISDLKQREEELTKKSQALEQLSNQLAKYLSPQVYDSIFSGRQEVKLVSKRKRLTVFFSDIIDFTRTTERLESEDLTRLLNHYLTEMSEIALAHGATIDKYVGDAIVIFFGDPESRGVKEDALSCVTMAIAMRERMKELESIWLDSGLEQPLQCRIGINTGLCTVGNFGSEDRMDYTIIGSGVNLAARLEKACPPGEILLSFETFAHVKDLVWCEAEGHIEAKGFAEPVSTFRVVDRYENLESEARPIRAALPNVRLEVDISRMSPEERRDATAVLQRVVDRITAMDRRT